MDDVFEKFDPNTHVCGLGCRLDELSSPQRSSVEELRQLLEREPVADGLADYVNNSVLVRFLIARDWNVEKAHAMMMTALQWRARRPCHRWMLQAAPGSSLSPPNATREKLFKQCGATGKIRVTGTDKHGRPVIVLDNSRENMVEADHMIDYLAYNMELCQRTALLDGRGADKCLLFMHMAGEPI